MNNLMTKLCKMNTEDFTEEARIKMKDFSNHIEILLDEGRITDKEIEKCAQLYENFFVGKRRKETIESLKKYISEEAVEAKDNDQGIERLFCELLLNIYEAKWAEQLAFEMEQLEAEKTQQVKRENTASSQKTPLSYKKIDDNTRELREKIKERNVLEGYDGNTFMTTAQLTKSKLFISEFDIGERRVALKKYVKDISRKMSKNEIRYLAIVSGLGRGKTFLTGLLVESICNINTAKQAIIYLSSQKAVQTQNGVKIWKQFLEKKLGRDRQYWVIIDGLDEIVNKNKNAVNLSRLNSAAEFYKAKIIIGCREPYYNQIYKEERKILFSDRIFLYDSQQESIGEEEYKEMKLGVPKRIIDKMMRSPLYRVWIMVALKTWKKVQDEENLSMQVFKNEYTFMEFLFKNTLLREKRNYNLSEEKIKGYYKVLQRIALVRNKFAGNVSAECLFNEVQGMDPMILKDSFVQNFVSIRVNNYEFMESVVCGFRVQEFGKYFYISGLCSALKDKTMLKEWMEDYELTIKKKDFRLGWQELTQDQKEKARKSLGELADEEEKESQLKTNIKIVQAFLE